MGFGDEQFCIHHCFRRYALLWAGLFFCPRSTVLRPDVDCWFLSEGRLPDVPEERSMPAAHAGMQIHKETQKKKKNASLFSLSS